MAYYRRHYKRRRITRKKGLRKYKRRRTSRRSAGSYFGKVKGYGAYRMKGVRNNSLLTGGMSPPQIMNRFSNDGIVYRHREFLGNLTLPSDGSSTTVALKNFNIQPQNTLILNPGTIGPWLRGCTENFKEYEWHGILIEYKPMTALATQQGAGAMGTVMIGTHYDMYEAPYEDKVQMLNSEFTTSAKPQIAQIHPIECKRSSSVLGRKFIRSPDDLSVGSDKRLYDHARVEIATEGIPGAPGDAIGEIWITYEVCVYKPKLVDKHDMEVEEAIQSFVFKSNFGLAASTTYSLLPFGQTGGTTLPAISSNSNMFGSLYPNGIIAGQTSAPPIYIFDADRVEVGDVFRCSLIIEATAGGNTNTFNIDASTALVRTYLGMYAWWGFINSSITGAPEALPLLPPGSSGPNFPPGDIYTKSPASNDGNVKSFTLEFYVYIQPGFNQQNPPQFQLNGNFTTSSSWASSGQTAQILIQKLKNHVFTASETGIVSQNVYTPGESNSFAMA